MKRDAAIHIIGENQCVGCYACITVCPHKALKMQVDVKGVLKPFVMDACIKCGLCSKVCPIINSDFQEKYYFRLLGGWSNSEQVQLASSSGGIFSEIAEQILNKRGYVVGAVWEDGRVKHKIISEKEDLVLLRGSKYQQSQNLDVIYSQVKGLVNQGKVVLFSGLPCQVAAIKRIVNSDLLLTVSVVCLGVPSWRVLQKHLAERYADRKIDKINFRNKQKGWTHFSIEYLEQNAVVDLVEHTKDLFYRLFNAKLIISPACFSCKFNECPRVGDITLGDYWGVEKQFYNPNGVSVVILSSQQGEKIVNALIENGKISAFQTSLVKASAVNWRVNGNRMDKPLLYDEFWRDLDSYSLSYLNKKYIKKESLLFRLKRKAKSLMDR